MINGITPVLEAIETCPDRTALLFPEQEPVSFADLQRQAIIFQSGLRHLGLSSGDTVLFAEGLSAELYGFVLAALGLGVSVAVVEPWMPLGKINSVVKGLHHGYFWLVFPGEAGGFVPLLFERFQNGLRLRAWQALAGHWLRAFMSNPLSGITLVWWLLRVGRRVHPRVLRGDLGIFWSSIVFSVRPCITISIKDPSLRFSPTSFLLISIMRSSLAS